MSALLNGLLKTITTAMKVKLPPFPGIPALLLLCEIRQRSGLSAIDLGTSIVTRCGSAGIPIGVNTDGSENLINKYSFIISEEVIAQMKTNSLVQCVIEPGSLVLTGTGVSATGPVEVTVINKMPIIVKGLLS